MGPRESHIGIAVLTFIVAATNAQFSSPSDVRGDCVDKVDGVYPTGHCSSYFLECTGGQTVRQNCSDGLWFNPQKLQCDYRENIAECQDPFSCVGRDDGVYGDGCTSMFWFCRDGQLLHSSCPRGTFFNIDTKSCDYKRNIRACGGDPNSTPAPRTRATRAPMSTTTTASSMTKEPSTESLPVLSDAISTEVPYGQTYPTYAPRQRISGIVAKTPLIDSTAGTACAGKEDGAHSLTRCGHKYVLCWAGTGEVLSCQEGLKFNEATGGCDYPGNVASCANGAASDKPSRKRIDSRKHTKVPARSSPTVSPASMSAYGLHVADVPEPSLPIPRHSSTFDCSGREDGTYGFRRCVEEFFQCVAGQAFSQLCPQGLVFDEKRKECTFSERCGVPPEAPLTPAAYVVTQQIVTDSSFDCSSRDDGSYSIGCVEEYFQCVAGRVYHQICPQGLVFDDVTKSCDYPEICTAPHLTGAQDVPTTPIIVSTTNPSVSVSPIDCSSRADGRYSDGCVPDFVQCVSGFPYPNRCPEGLVFDGASQSCQYPLSCGQPRPLDDYVSQTVTNDVTSSNVLPSNVNFDCSTRTDGMYSNGCTTDFFQCVGGIVYAQRCPSGLVFDGKVCEYPERCGLPQVEKPSADVSRPTMSSVVITPTLAPVDIDCSGRPDGQYSNGCTRGFVQCVNGMGLASLCPEGLFFVQETARCDYPLNCAPASTVDVQLPSVQRLEPTAPATTTAEPARDGLLIDCISLTDGLYSSGCSSAFVQCSAGNAYPLECPTGLVFDKSQLQCVWPESCSDVSPTVTLPTVSIPVDVAEQNHDAPKPIIDLDEDSLTTDAPLPMVHDDGSTCTGKGRRAMGTCSSGFVQCIGGKLIARRCPGQSLFDDKIGLCVYDLDGCEMDEVIETTEQESTPVATSDAPVKPVFGVETPILKEIPQHNAPSTPSSDQYIRNQQNDYQQQVSYQQSGYRQSSYQPAGSQQADYQQTGYQQTGYQQSDYQQTKYQQQEQYYQPSPAQQYSTDNEQRYEQPTQQYSYGGEYNQYPQSINNGVYEQPQVYDQSQNEQVYTSYVAPSKVSSYQQTIAAQEPLPQYAPAYSSFDNSGYVPTFVESAPIVDTTIAPECEGSEKRRVAACSIAYEECSPTARRWIRKACGKSHRFDSTINKCKAVYEIRECDEPMSSYIPPLVQEQPSVIAYPEPSRTDFVVPSGNVYENKEVLDPFYGGHSSGRIATNPFYARGVSGSFYTPDGFSWIGSAVSDGHPHRQYHKSRGAPRLRKGYVLVEGNPFGYGRSVSKELNDEWKGHRVHDGLLRSPLLKNKHRVRGLKDAFKGKPDPFVAPLSMTNPFVRIRGSDGNRRRGRRRCDRRRSHHKRRHDDDDDDEDCEWDNDEDEREKDNGVVKKDPMSSKALAEQARLAVKAAKNWNGNKAKNTGGKTGGKAQGKSTTTTTTTTDATETIDEENETLRVASDPDVNSREEQSTVIDAEADPELVPEDIEPILDSEDGDDDTAVEDGEATNIEEGVDIERAAQNGEELEDDQDENAIEDEEEEDVDDDGSSTDVVPAEDEQDENTVEDDEGSEDDGTSTDVTGDEDEKDVDYETRKDEEAEAERIVSDMEENEENEESPEDEDDESDEMETENEEESVPEDDEKDVNASEMIDDKEDTVNEDDDNQEEAKEGEESKDDEQSQVDNETVEETDEDTTTEEVSTELPYEDEKDNDETEENVDDENPVDETTEEVSTELPYEDEKDNDETEENVDDENPVDEDPALSESAEESADDAVKELQEEAENEAFEKEEDVDAFPIDDKEDAESVPEDGDKDVEASEDSDDKEDTIDDEEGKEDDEEGKEDDEEEEEESSVEPSEDMSVESDDDEDTIVNEDMKGDDVNEDERNETIEEDESAQSEDIQDSHTSEDDVNSEEKNDSEPVDDASDEAEGIDVAENPEEPESIEESADVSEKDEDDADETTDLPDDNVSEVTEDDDDEINDVADLSVAQEAQDRASESEDDESVDSASEKIDETEVEEESDSTDEAENPEEPESIEENADVETSDATVDVEETEEGEEEDAQDLTEEETPETPEQNDDEKNNVNDEDSPKETEDDADDETNMEEVDAVADDEDIGDEQVNDDTESESVDSVDKIEETEDDHDEHVEYADNKADTADTEVDDVDAETDDDTTDASEDNSVEKTEDDDTADEAVNEVDAEGIVDDAVDNSHPEEFDDSEDDQEGDEANEDQTHENPEEKEEDLDDDDETVDDSSTVGMEEKLKSEGVELPDDDDMDLTRFKRYAGFVPVAAHIPQNTKTTVTRRLLVPRSSRLHRSRFSRLCSSSTSGSMISIGQCRQDFIYCKSARRPIVAACPVGDLFDAMQSTCVPTEICGVELSASSISSPSRSHTNHHHSHGQIYRPMIPTLTEQTTTIVTTTSTVKTDFIVSDAVTSSSSSSTTSSFSCDGRSDGAYASGSCTSAYFVCASGNVYSYNCPEGLVYDRGTDACEWPANLIECGVSGTPSADVPTTVASTTLSNEYFKPTYTPVAAEYTKPDRSIVLDVPTTLAPMTVRFDCGQKKDGGFAIDCKGGFVMCANGMASLMRCPPALTFDEATQACQYPAHVPTCGMNPISTEPITSNAVVSSTPTTIYPSTSAPIVPVDVSIQQPTADKNACVGRVDGIHEATRGCASAFVICKHGEMEAVMSCPSGTFFNIETKGCDYRENACSGGWTGQAHGIEEPVTEAATVSNDASASTSGPYRPEVTGSNSGSHHITRGHRIHHHHHEEEVKTQSASTEPYRPKLPISVEKLLHDPVVTHSDVQPVAEATCNWKGPSSSGVCSAHFTICNDGKPDMFDCQSPLVFDDVTSSCAYRQFVQGCPEFGNEKDKPSADVSSSTEKYSRNDSPSTTTLRPLPAPSTGAPVRFEATGSQCMFNPEQPAFPLNYCSMTYGVCTVEGVAFNANCTFGSLFDSVIRQCVPAEHCGQSYLKEISGFASSAPSPSSDPHRHTDWSGDVRCVGVKDGILKATALCSGHYIRCDKESVTLQTCSGAAEVFSPVTGRCVLRVQMSECASSKGTSPAITRPKFVKETTAHDEYQSKENERHVSSKHNHRGSKISGSITPITSFDPLTFCATKHADGLYRNPENCAGIVQCFGGEAFSYPSCTPGLFFNEMTSVCDYASNVPQCSTQSDVIALDSSSKTCSGQPHGAHLADDKDCSTYYRCVWGSLERLSCPGGTVFNPRLSVCDYPSEVPHCANK